MATRIINYFDHLCEFERAVEYQLDHREISQLDHKENKVYTLGLSQLSVFIAVAMNTDDFFSYQCICFIFSMIELRNFSMIELVLYLYLYVVMHGSSLFVSDNIWVLDGITYRI